MRTHPPNPDNESATMQAGRYFARIVWQLWRNFSRLFTGAVLDGVRVVMEGVVRVPPNGNQDRLEKSDKRKKPVKMGDLSALGSPSRIGNSSLVIGVTSHNKQEIA